MADRAIPDETRFRAALDLAHAAQAAGDEVALIRSARAALTSAPQAIYPTIAAEVAELRSLCAAASGVVGRAS
uniref:Uncharacterized protein n=1 Tax=uncultured bacterium esnapd22 TaxID=1366604 RepID=S5TV86_9BACT|nr:hypothetical protein [uncultured bacterium esnapd22]